LGQSDSGIVRFRAGITLPGVLDDGLLADWCLRYLGVPLDRVLFRSGFLSEVVGVELSSGLRVVVKARPFQPRIAGCLQVQAALASVGFPCPEPLASLDAPRPHPGARIGMPVWQAAPLPPARAACHRWIRATSSDPDALGRNGKLLACPAL